MTDPTPTPDVTKVAESVVSAVKAKAQAEASSILQDAHRAAQRVESGLVAVTLKDLEDAKGFITKHIWIAFAGLGPGAMLVGFLIGRLTHGS